MRSYFIVGKIFSFVFLKNESGFSDEGTYQGEVGGRGGESIFPKFCGVLLIKVVGGGAHIASVIIKGAFCKVCYHLHSNKVYV